MRAAKRALGERSPHRARLKGATSRSVRPLAARRSRGTVALFKRVFSEAPPQAASPHGVIFVPHFMREHGGEDIPVFVPAAGGRPETTIRRAAFPQSRTYSALCFLSVHVGLKPYAKQFRPVGALIFRLPAGTPRGTESNPLKSPKSLFVFARPAPKTRTSSPPKAHKKRSREISPRERLSLSSKP